MNTQTVTEIRAELNELQQQAVDLAAVNAPMPAKVTRRTLRALVRRGLLTEDEGGFFWVTDLGRQCATPAPAPQKKTRAPRKPTNCEQCDIRLTPARRSDLESMCTYCMEAGENYNCHQDGDDTPHTAEQPCTECGTYDPTAHYASKPRQRKAQVPQECRCGCEGMTKGGNYLPGHDARHSGQVARFAVESGLTPTQVTSLLDERFWDTPALEAKCRASIARLQAKATKRAAK